MASLSGDSNDMNVAAVRGEHFAGHTGAAAIVGVSEGRGVLGVSGGGAGVWGQSTSSTGVVGVSQGGVGTSGESASSTGVLGISQTGFAIHGVGNDGPGVVGTSKLWVGVYGETDGIENGPAGVWGEHKGAGTGVKAVAMNGVALAAFSNNLAGFFQGNVEVTGDIRLPNADCAEEFSILDPEAVQPGTVMVLCGEGLLQASRQAYDKRVAGVVSGAGSYRPGIVLDRQAAQANRMPVALLGKVYCKVDAGYGAIEVGDLLTTSPTAGHAMKAVDPFKSFGAVIGKALRPFQAGQGLIPILIALQ